MSQFFWPGQLFLIFLPFCSSMNALKQVTARVSNSYTQSYQDNFILGKSESCGEVHSGGIVTIHHMTHSQPHDSKPDHHHELFYNKCEESCCLCSCTLHGWHHFHTERFTTEMQRLVISNSDHNSTMCWACALRASREV